MVYQEKKLTYLQKTSEILSLFKNQYFYSYSRNISELQIVTKHLTHRTWIGQCSTQPNGLYCTIFTAVHSDSAQPCIF